VSVLVLCFGKAQHQTKWVGEAAAVLASILCIMVMRHTEADDELQDANMNVVQRTAAA
jgi:hypothetical protein